MINTVKTRNLLNFLWGNGDPNSYGLAFSPLRLVLLAELPLKFFDRLATKTENPVLDLLCSFGGMLGALVVLGVVIAPATALLVATVSASLAATILVSPFTFVADVFYSRSRADKVAPEPKKTEEKRNQESSSSKKVLTVAKPGVAGPGSKTTPPLPPPPPPPLVTLTLASARVSAPASPRRW